MLRGYDILCMASANWDGLWVNAQNIMHRLAKYNRILYVESIGLRPPARQSHSDQNRMQGRLQSFRAGLRQPETDRELYIASPVILPWHQSAIIRDCNDAWLTWWLQRHMASIGMEHPLLWIFLPTAAGLIGRLQECGSLYFCVDEYKNNPGVHAPTIAALEQTLLSKTDIVFTTSPALYESRRLQHPHTYYTPNTADTASFLNASRTTKPDDIKKITGPILGFTGNIAAYKIDLPLLLHAAQAKPDWNFVFIGPVGSGDASTDISALQALSNVHFLGRKPAEQLPDYVAHFDIGLIPNTINETTRASFPMKFYEYMAAGLPIVASKLSALLPYQSQPELCRMYENETDFVSVIEDVLQKECSVEIVRKRQQEAARFDWEPRLQFISETIEQRLDIRSPS